MNTYSHSLRPYPAVIVVSVVVALIRPVLMHIVQRPPEHTRKAVIVTASFLLGGGIWPMQCLAMLSMKFPMPINADLLLILSSCLVAVLVVGFALPGIAMSYSHTNCAE